MAYNQEMKRRYDAGDIGEFKYGEGEYVHPDPPEVKLARSVGTNHWRNWIPATYYCTHALAPVMYITDTRPVKVNGFVVLIFVVFVEFFNQICRICPLFRMKNSRNDFKMTGPTRPQRSGGRTVGTGE